MTQFQENALTERRTDGRTQGLMEGQTEGWTLFSRTLPVTAGGPIRELNFKNSLAAKIKEHLVALHWVQISINFTRKPN